MIAGIHARRMRKSLVPALELLQAEGIHVTAIHPVHDMREVADVISRARAGGIKQIIAAGGDGTVGTVVDSIVNTDAILGILPLGTSNDIARSIGLPLDVREACRCIAIGTPRVIDCGLATTDGGDRRYFAHAATVGLNSKFARLATSAEWRNRFGRFAYPAAALHALQRGDSIEMRIVADDKVLRRRIIQATVINAPVFGGAMGFRVPDSSLTDRRLDLVVVGNVTAKVLLRSLIIVLGGKRGRISLTHLTHPKRIRVETAEPQDVYCDGERMGTTPVTIVSVNRALTVVG